MILTEQERHTCREIQPVMFHCGSCDCTINVGGTPNYCPWCGIQFSRFEYMNGEIEKH